MWDRAALDLGVPAQITFEQCALRHLQMIAVEGGLDCRFDGNRVEFSWFGDDEGQPIGGRGWAELEKDGKLRGSGRAHLGRSRSGQGRGEGDVGRSESAWRCVAPTARTARRTSARRQ